MKYILDYSKYNALAVEAVSEGQVLLKNENKVLPVSKGAKVAVFGRIQHHYYKSGTGSGGMVNVNRVVTITDALKEASKSGDIVFDEELEKIYLDWERDNPYYEGLGWAAEPDSQLEMPLESDVVNKAASKNDYAVVIIGRLAGEDRDNRDADGSYRLTDGERDMLAKVCNAFSKVVVVLNVGNIIDMSFVNEYKIDALLYAWQGGMLGGYGTVDVLLGKTNPSGKLPDTIARSLQDYPSYNNFGDPNEAVYAEDIFVGYRYFETFAPEKVLYPFGYGLSYTAFEISAGDVQRNDTTVTLNAEVKNLGDKAGKEVVQVYCKAPSGKLSKALKVLVAYKKTELLNPGEKETISFDIPIRNFTSYDDDGRCGLGTGFVLEKGTYEILVGNNVRDCKNIGSFDIEKDLMVEALVSALKPVKPFERLNSKGEYEKAPLREDTQKDRRLKNLPQSLPTSADKGYKLSDVCENKVSMEDFISQLSLEELCTMIRGEGMGSMLVTPGTAAAVGGIIPSLKEKGIPICCMDDGPSGMRLDSGVKAFSIPNGTLLSSTFNPELNEALFEMLGIEMLKNKVDVLLGPGMNIHRHPLNGRNFEYFSEDPYLTGTIGAAQIKGLKVNGVTGTIKHFACNNQETGRQIVNPVVSEKALREIYLRGFEIAVKAGADSVMTTYCQINGVYTAGNYDLNTTILRNQWGFKGIVMTDWWANVSEEGAEGSKENFAAMVRAQNDLYMCVPKATADVGDNALSDAQSGALTAGELQRCAANICDFLTKQALYKRFLGEEITVEVINQEEGYDEVPAQVEYIPVNSGDVIDLSYIEATKGSKHFIGISLPKMGPYEFELTGRGLPGNELAQLPAVLYLHSSPVLSLNCNGDGKWISAKGEGYALFNNDIMSIFFTLGGVELKSVKITYIDR